jgi:GAF domain-containing protein
LITKPIGNLADSAGQLTSGNLDVQVKIERNEEIGALAFAFNSMASQLRNFIDSLEQRVDERTRDLERRTSQLEAIADVARSVASIQEMDLLLPAITRLVSERFGFYHVGIFLLDDDHEFALLQASNSEGGAKMLARGHRLQVGQQGIVGYVALHGTARVALDVGEEAVFFNNPDLPETHSEVALPLKFGREIIGALDIQSTEVNAFSQEDVELFSILADQVSVAIQNARSLEQAQRALQEAEIASSQLTGQAWRGYAEGIRTKGYRYDGIKPEPLRRDSKSVDEKEAFIVPVQLRGQIIGRLKIKPSDASRQWTEDERAIIESTAERTAIAMDSARLLDDAQKRAARETFLSELASKLGTSFQLDSVLRDTVEELGQTLKGSTVTFQLVNPASSPTAENEAGSAHRKNAE